MRKIGRYEITRELGRGAMGVVYHAVDPTIGRPVAIKTLRLRDVDDAEKRKRLRERLFREARSAGALSHPGIVTIYDMDEQEGTAFIAMEFVDGPTLEQLMSGPKALPRDRVLSILKQTAAALDYAHQKGIVHRDIKPANIMLDATGAVKIADFGIAKIAELEGQTMTGAMLGTPNYMSPEQVQGEPVQGRSDQFALAVVAYEILAGQRPFAGEQLSTVVYKIVAEAPPAIQTLNTSLGERVDPVLKRALSKKPERRYADCSSFVTALDTACAASKTWRVPVRKNRTHFATTVTKVIARTEKTSAFPTPAPIHRRSWVGPFALGFLALCGLLGILAWQANLFFIPNVMPPSPKPPVVQSATRAPEPVPAAVGPQEISISTAPAGAFASLDGAEDERCVTPCRLSAKPGVHGLSVTREGFQTESREVRVASAPVDLPLIQLQSADGALMLSTDPPGADVSVDGNATGAVTPVRLTLAPGTHRITVQKGEAKSTNTVDIKNSGTFSLRVKLPR